MCQKNSAKEAVLFCNHSTWKTLRFQRHTIMRTSFISVFLMRIEFTSSLVFFLCFSPSQAVIIVVVVIKSKNVLSSKLKFTKNYWISNKNKKVAYVYVIGWFFTILFSFPLPFIYTSFMFVIGSSNFDALENLKCVGSKG